jgi:mitogen-activated protein kinase kinase 4
MINSFLGAFGSVNKMVFKKNNSVMAVKRIRSTVDEREQKSLLMDLEVVMKSKGCPYIVMFNGAIFKVRIFRCTWGPWLMQ